VQVASRFERDRPKAIGLAFNGASVGGVLFVPLWVLLIDDLGFEIAAPSVAAVTVIAVALLTARYFSPTPASLGLRPDGGGAPAAVAKPASRLSRSQIVWTPRFLTLSGAFALRLFAQIGLLSHLIVRLTPDVGVARAGLLFSLATKCAVIGRTLAGWWIGDHDRRIAATVNFAVQILGVLLLTFGHGWVLLALGYILFGWGIGNLTSLPPLIAQTEFNREDVVTAVALIVAINQAVFAFAPAIVGAFRDATSNYVLPFGIVACVQLLAATVILLGRGTTASPKTSG
jgi:predicted MFS family arabinose efflux permease